MFVGERLSPGPPRVVGSGSPAMGQYFSLSGETSVGIVLAEVLDEKPDTERYAFLAALPDALKEVEAYAATSEAHQAAMRVRRARVPPRFARARARDPLSYAPPLLP